MLKISVILSSSANIVTVDLGMCVCVVGTVVAHGDCYGVGNY